MSVIQDLRKEIIDYATNNCKTEIIDFNPPGSVLNKGEEFTFKIRVKNESCLDMKDVTVQATGTSYASVHKHIMWYSGPAISFSFNLDAFATHTSEVFHGKALIDSNGTKVVMVTARITKWDASLDHLLKDHSGAGAAEGILKEIIYKS